MIDDSVMRRRCRPGTRAAPRVLTPTQRHAELFAASLAEVPEARRTLPHDLHTAVLMREHGIGRIVTRDRDFLRFPFLTAVDPLRVAPGP